jgi:tetratricopeptide (TPR) repeat protein
MSDATMEEEMEPPPPRDDDVDGDDVVANASIPPHRANVAHPTAPPPNISEDDSASAATDIERDDDDDDDDYDDDVIAKDKSEDDDDVDVPPPTSSSSSSSSSDPTDALLAAMSHKDAGNDHFKSGNYPDAIRSYRRGTNALKNLNLDNAGDVQVKSLLITLQTNLSMVTYRQGKYKLSRDVATKAVDIDAVNVKALYRRAMAHRMLGDVDSARDDLKSALLTEPNNVAVRKELSSVKKILDERRARERAGLQRAFSGRNGGSSILYSDKEEEERQKENDRKEKERLELLAIEGRKKEWEDECVRRMAR